VVKEAELQHQSHVCHACVFFRWTWTASPGPWTLTATPSSKTERYEGVGLWPLACYQPQLAT
jgi:hypothetical protein